MQRHGGATAVSDHSTRPKKPKSREVPRPERTQNQRKKPDQNPLFLHRQRSCTEFSRFENEKKINNAAKENQKPVFGGSMRYTGKFKLKSFKSSYLPDDHSVIVPGRFSVDENAFRRKSSSRGLSDSETQDSESEYSDICSGGGSFDAEMARKDTPASYMAPTVSSRRHGIEVASKFMHDSASKRWSADSGHNQKPVSSDNQNNSPKIFTVKNGSGNWASSPGRSGSPKDNKGKMMSPKPPTSPSRGKGVGNILSLGIELLRGKKSYSSTASSRSGLGEMFIN
ncbi:UNVERIFIED_CONTAM: hypothetical protein Scaly_2624300 [Sesamum calycinum]|uniref:Uncharacterized protein n=1 Tax=Sesamum calycinum TaxID=2727403 RepID=A0AAW2JAN4_9LAMI